MEYLKPSADRKVWAYKNQKNTYGLLPGPEGTCPGATLGPGGCRQAGPGRPSCYVYKLMAIYKGVRNVLEHNTRLLTEADMSEKVRLLDDEIERFKRVARNAEVSADLYRLHWSGDIFDREYAEALRAMMLIHSDIRFWTYTRTFDVLDVFGDVPNFELYLSLDACNVDRGLEAYEQNNRDTLHLCYMGVDAPEGVGDEGFLGCPVDAGNMALEGACQKCMLCLRKHNIWFKTR